MNMALKRIALIDIGKFAFIKLPFKDNSPSYECLDGKQRVTTIIEFYEGRFAYNGLTYQHMHPSDQNHFDCYSISVAKLQPMTDQEKYKYFLKLNTSGKPVDPGHLAHVKNLLALSSNI